MDDFAGSFITTFCCISLLATLGELFFGYCLNEVVLLGMNGIGSGAELAIEVAGLSDLKIAPFVNIPFSGLAFVNSPLWTFPLVKIPFWIDPFVMNETFPFWRFPLVKIPTFLLWKFELVKMFPFVNIPLWMFPFVKIPKFPLWRFPFGQNWESPSEWPTRTTWWDRGLESYQFLFHLNFDHKSFKFKTYFLIILKHLKLMKIDRLTDYLCFMN